MNIKNYLKLELLGWSKFEIIGLLVVFNIILINSLILHDSFIAILSACCGILYTIIAGKGKISCYFFGLISTICYSYLSYENGLYGNLLLNLGYYFPMQILGIFVWKNNLKKSTNEIMKTNLKEKEFLKLLSITILVCFTTILILYFINDSHPCIDSITTVFSILGMYLTIKRCIEQWIVWTIVNASATIVWINIALHGQGVYSTGLMWLVYLIKGIYFYFKWNKELKSENVGKSEKCY